jgi:membrane-associated phospholipid phosphatase
MLLEADASPPPRDQSQPRPTIARLVPNDPFFWVRVVAMTVYAIAYVIRFKTNGLIIDRISVGISVGIFLLCAFAGKPWRRWIVLTIDAVLYALMWFCYEMTRGAADHLGFPFQVQAPRNIDRALAFGYDPNVWMQQHFYHADDIKWYDNVASVMYYTHFVVPVIALAVLWAASRVQWVRFMKRFASLLAVSCLLFVIMPTVPPWMASSTKYPYRLFPPLARSTGRGFRDLGFKGFVNDWQNALDWGNAVAAMPSLHSAFALFVPAFFLPMIKPTWLKGIALLFPVMMLTSLVYFGEHWIIDGLVGWALVGASFKFWNWFEARQRAQRAARAHQALAVTT